MIAGSERRDARDWDVAVGTGLLRLVVGLGLWRWRDRAITVAGGDARDRVLRALFGYFAVRDIAVGVATLATTRPGADVANAVRVQALADTTDAVAVSVVTQAGRLPKLRGQGAVALALGTGAAEWALWWKLRRG